MEKEINYRKKSIPAGPSEKQITNDGLKAKKGSADFTSAMPTKNMIPDGTKGKK
jgi:hypothetical protein